MTSLIPKILFFTFEWSSARAAVEEQELHFLLSNKLTKDLPLLCEYIEQIKPSIVIGFSNSHWKKVSFIEPQAVNIFHKTKKIIKDGPAIINLTIPKLNISHIRINSRIDDTFCNYAAYRVANFCLPMGIKTIYIHNTKNQIHSIIEELSQTILE